MKIVIEIREKSYENLQVFKDKDLSRPEIAVKHGIPLPKGHGRLIDAGKLTDEILKYQDKCRPNKNEYEMALYQAYDYAIYEIEDATTIIEADKEKDDPSHPFADDVMMGGDE